MLNKIVVSVGDKFGNLEVKEYLGTKPFGKLNRTESAYSCYCKCCGTIKTIRRAHLISNNYTSCGCQMKNHLKPPKTGKRLPDLRISGLLWNRIKNGAKNRSIELSITKEYIFDLFLSQGCKCAISKIDIKLPISNNDSKIENLASLDRIDNTKGYIEGNVRWVSWKINRLKHSMSDKEMYEICDIILRNKP